MFPDGINRNGGDGLRPEDLLQGFYVKFRDKVESIANARGQDNPRWEDVFLALIQNSKTSEILRDRGASLGALDNDIRYTMYFGRPERDSAAPATHPDQIDIHNEALAEYVVQIERLIEHSQHQATDPAYQEACEKLMSFLRDYMYPGNMDREKGPKGKVKQLLTEATLSTFLQGQGHPAVLTLAIVLEQHRDFISYFQKRILDVSATPLGILDALEKEAGINLTPFQLVQFVLIMSGDFTSYLLYRNGFPAPDHYKAPYRLPPQRVVNLALNAVARVEDNREREVEVKHLLPDLLGDWEVRARLKELGVTDYTKFYTRLTDALEPEASSEERFRHHVTVSKELLDFLEEAADIVNQGNSRHAPSRLLIELLELDEIRTLFVTAGIEENKLDELPDLVTKAQESVEEEEGKGNDKGFKISDERFEGLLKKYGKDLTKAALEGGVSPVIGRQSEIDQMITVLLQRNRGNPLLIGEPGVGKTALFGGLAQVVADGNVPDTLMGSRIFTIDLNAMNSGPQAMFRGGFEGILLPIIEGVAERNAAGEKIILCMDEIHAALVAGAASGTPGAGQLLKPYLTEGNLFVVGTTTQEEYARDIQGDGALDRRFQTITIDPPTTEQTIEILKGSKAGFQDHHGVKIPDAVLVQIVELTSRYLPNMHQPDNALTQLDAACARAKIGDENVLTIDTVIETVAISANLDPSFLKKDDTEKFLDLKVQLPGHVLGQDEATHKVADGIISAKAGLQDPRKPLGSFLFLGPTGVGKTETARATAEIMHGTEEALVRIDMSDFQQSHSVSRLVGAPPGYVGYDKEGQLTGAIRRQPYCVLMLDEIEKAHPDVFDLLLPVLEEGELVDGKGRTVSFRNTIILMSSNVPAEMLERVFPAEFLNRLNGWVVYEPLNQEVIEQLVDREVTAIGERLQKRWGVGLEISPEARQGLVEEGYCEKFGARHLKRVCATQLISPLSHWVLSQGQALQEEGGIVHVSGLNSHFAAELKPQSGNRGGGSASTGNQTAAGAANYHTPLGRKPSPFGIDPLFAAAFLRRSRCRGSIQ